MTTLTEIETAVQRLSADEKQILYEHLADQLRDSTPSALQSREHSFLDIPQVHLGRILVPEIPGDDLLEEMLEGRA